MEQWVADGRTIMHDRGLSLIPQGVEKDGFSEDLSKGYRGLLKKVLAHGHGETPQLYAECHCDFEYFNVDGAVVDSSEPRYPLEVVVGAGQVTQGFDEALLTMREGEEAMLWLDPAFAFRDHGFRSARGSVHPDEPVRLRVVLRFFYNPLSAGEKLNVAIRLKDEGNAAFKAEDFEFACVKYHDALRKLGSKLQPSNGAALRESPDVLERLEGEALSLRANLNNNIAACWFLRGDNDKCLQFVNKAILIDKHHAKALFRKALVLERRLEFDESLRILQILEDENLGVPEEVVAAQKRIRDKNATQTAAQTNTYKKMFWGA